MKLNIVKDNEQSIDGYENINIVDNLEHLDEIFDNSCDEVLINESISALTKNEANEVLSKCLSKVSINGCVVIKFLDFQLIGEAIYHSAINQKQFNEEILSKLKSVFSLAEILSELNNRGFDTKIDFKSCWCGYVIHSTRN